MFCFAAAAALALRTLARAGAVEALPAVTRALAPGTLAGAAADIALHSMFVHTGPLSILIIDNYDSFTFNLVSLVTAVDGENPVVIRNDEMTREEIRTAVFHKGSVTIGAGGAIVARSDPGAEWEQMRRSRRRRCCAPSIRPQDDNRVNLRYASDYPKALRTASPADCVRRTAHGSAV
jgi:hypothetical protein